MFWRKDYRDYGNWHIWPNYSFKLPLTASVTQYRHTDYLLGGNNSLSSLNVLTLPDSICNRRFVFGIDHTGGISRRRLCFPFWLNEKISSASSNLFFFFPRLPQGLQSAPSRQSTNPKERRRRANPCRTSAKTENSKQVYILW